MDELAALRAAASNVRFDTKRAAFVVGSRLTRGLTKLVWALVPVPQHAWPTASCVGCTELQRRARGETIERQCHVAPPPARRAGPLLQSKKRRRASSSAFELIVVASTTPVAAAAAGTRERTCKGGRDAREHGKAVDRDIDRYVARPASLSRPAVDPCAVMLVAFMRESLGLVPVATQVPIYSSRLNFATAIDVLAVDVRTRSKLYLIEVKSSRMGGGATKTSAHACYTHDAAPGTRLRALPAAVAVSTYWQHQLQLWAMVSTVRREYGVALAGAAVIRTSPRTAFHYTLEPALEAADARLVAAFRAL